MIPFGSQRGYGGDLATHLLNAHDNERVELAEIRGAIARDLHGAMEEWELHAQALTRCEKYLYSLSINPDPKHGDLTPEQYSAYIDKAEEALGLSGQPRAVVFHEKYGRHHCHVVWSRIDTLNGKAVHIAFDRQKLMAVTREFAREHGLELPKGYFERGGGEALTLYDKVKENETGLSREDHREIVTQAWRMSDSPRAFVRALEERGYLLATGKRPYVLVDVYGGMHALPRLIADKQVRSKDVQEFLGRDYPPESLPTVEEAQKLVAKHRSIQDAVQASEQRAAALEELKQMQQTRRTELEGKFKQLKARHHGERERLAAAQKAEREQHNAAFRAQVRAVRAERQRRQPHGLAAFLGRITGVALVRRKWHRYQDRKRAAEFLRIRDEIRNRQEAERQALKQQQILQKRELERQERALRKVENRERRSLDTQQLAQARTAERGGREMPSLREELTPPAREKGELSIAHNTASGIRTRVRDKRQLSREFAKAAGGREQGGRDESGSEQRAPKRTRQPRGRRRDRDYDRER